MFGFEITSILWGIRTLRNAIRFNDKQADFEATLEAIKYRSWSWARAYVTLMLHYMFGNLQPKEYLQQLSLSIANLVSLFYAVGLFSFERKFIQLRENSFHSLSFCL